MPVRLLKPGLRTSEKFNRCSFMAQSGYVRLLTMVDDAGRYLANPRLLRSELFPLGDHRGADISTASIETMLSELVRSGLIQLYESESKSYLQLTSWNERVRTQSKFPEPANPECEKAVVSNCVQPLASPPSPSPSPSPSPRQLSECLVSPETIYEMYPLKVGKRAALKAIQNAINRGNSSGELLEKTRRFSIVRNGNLEFCPHPSTWFNQDRFDDDPKTWIPKSPPEQSKRPLSVMEMRSVLEAKKTEAANLKNKFCNEGPLSTTWSNERARLECVKLFSEIKQLNHQLASMA